MAGKSKDTCMAHLSDLRQNAQELLDTLQDVHNQHEARIFLTAEGEPVAVLQSYPAYQALLKLLEDTQRNLHIAEAHLRLCKMKQGQMNTVSLEQVLAQRHASTSNESASSQTPSVSS